MTKLSPLEEHLFQAWARAHGVDNHDDPNNQFDHRGLYKQSNGQIFPGHVIRQMAADHNAAAQAGQDTGGTVENPDPFAAAAQIHGDKLKHHSDQIKEQNKAQLEREKMHHKLLIEKMKLDHKTQESEKDRQHKAEAEQRSAQMQVAQHHMDRQAAMQDAQVQRQHQLEDTHMQRQAQVEDQVRGHHLEMEKVKEVAAHKPMTTAGQPTQGPAQMGPGQPPPHPGAPSLQSVLMQRMMSNGRPN